jgi:hypothetical protein
MLVHHLSGIPDSVANVVADKSYHVLTEAHVGFSVLGSFGRAYKMDLGLLKKFAAEVNEKRDLGSLHPKFPLSALPTVYTRDDDPEVRRRAIPLLREFLELNESTIKARKIIFDFQGHLGKSHFEECLAGFESAVIEALYLIYPSA